MSSPMNCPKCEFCSDEAVGYDEEDLPTCGDATTCTKAVAPLGVVEVSSGDEEDGR